MHTNMMRILKLAVALLAVPPLAQAGNVYNATILNVVPTRYNPANGTTPFFVVLNQNDSNIGCNASAPNQFALDAGSTGGKAMIASVLVAHATGQTVSVFGDGACDVASNVESASAIEVN